MGKIGCLGWLIIIIILASLFGGSGNNNSVENSIKSSASNQKSSATVTAKAKESYKSWALDNTAVTYFEYPEGSDWQIWVRLTADKYTTEDNVESIAIYLARAYKMQTGYDGLVIVTVWHPYQDQVYIKGHLQ